MEERNYVSWRSDKSRGPVFSKTDPAYPATRLFDNLSYIGTPAVGCFLLETTKGSVLLDCMNPDQVSVDIIERGIKDLGFKLDELTAILITHGHGDHWGKAGYFKKKYGTRIYMSRLDYEFASNVPEPFPWENVDFTPDVYLEDMGRYSFGDTTITVVWTPGHSAGCMSFLVPVLDEGKSRYGAMWGGAGVRVPGVDIDAYLESVCRFKEICREFKADCEFSSHPFIDNGILKLDIIRNIARGVPNPFVMGMEGLERFLDSFYEAAVAEKEKRMRL